jgi:exportin-2 (importin alpha re-exporter)
MEEALYSPFAFILQQDIQGEWPPNALVPWSLLHAYSHVFLVEFVPYVFQLFAALLELNPSASLANIYKSLIPPILTPVLWESKGNIPALVRLLSSMIIRGAPDMVADNQVEPILGIFQKLISTRANETHAFDLVETVIANFPL